MQTYPHLELLISCDDAGVLDEIRNDDLVRLILSGPHDSIGRKRNQLCREARGDVIAHWDDDDYSAPERIERQVDALCKSGLSVHGYRSMRFTDGKQWWLYTGMRGYAIGTSLMYHRDWWRSHPFLELQVGEDNEFVTSARSAGQLAVDDAGELMWASIHPGNTSPRALGGNNWKRI